MKSIHDLADVKYGSLEDAQGALDKIKELADDEDKRIINISLLLGDVEKEIEKTQSIIY